MKGISNTSRTLCYIREQGWVAERDSLGRFVNGSKGHSTPHSDETKKKLSKSHIGMRNSPEMKQWRRAVFDRDNYRCVLCSSNSNQLQADHIYPFFRMFDELQTKTLKSALNCQAFWDIKNGRTLCLDCHRSVRVEGEFRMAGKTNTQRTLEYIRKQGWQCEVVERWIRNPKHPAGGFRKDWMGFGDILAMGENSIIAIQSCGQAFSEHNRKITEDEKVAPNAHLWLKNGGRLILIGWRKVLKKRGGKLKIWAPRIKEYTIEDFK